MADLHGSLFGVQGGGFIIRVFAIRRIVAYGNRFVGMPLTDVTSGFRRCLIVPMHFIAIVRK